MIKIVIVTAWCWNLREPAHSFPTKGKCKAKEHHTFQLLNWEGKCNIKSVFHVFDLPPIWGSSWALKSSWTPCHCVRQWLEKHCQCYVVQKPLYSWEPWVCGHHLPVWGFCYRPKQSSGSQSRWHQLAHPELSRYSLLGRHKTFVCLHGYGADGMIYREMSSSKD